MRVTKAEYQKLAGRRSAGGSTAARTGAASLPSAPKKVIRQSSKGPNKTEIRFEQDHLRFNPAVKTYDFESVTLRLANGLRYTPDWFVEMVDGQIHLHEVKGAAPLQDDSIAKIKMAASRYPMFRFFLDQWKGGEWITQEVRA